MITARNLRVVLMVLALPVLLAGCAGGSVSSFSAPLTAIVAFGLQAGLSHMNRLGTESLE